MSDQKRSEVVGAGLRGDVDDNRAPLAVDTDRESAGQEIGCVLDEWGM